ncbi:hypothetical protein ERJ75_001411500 [Trypanosoma vivax]|nr:hypothetical protein ERJ75_001411500 [Trypanosoma vivax]
MQGASKALRARLPAKVRDLIVAEAAGGSLWLCKRDWRESVAMSDLRSASDQPFESSSPDKVTPSEEEAPFLYDVMRIRKGKITFEHDHFVRIRDSCLIVVNLGAKATDCDDSHLVDNAEDVSRISSCVEYVMETIKEFVRYFTVMRWT